MWFWYHRLHSWVGKWGISHLDLGITPRQARGEDGGGRCSRISNLWTFPQSKQRRAWDEGQVKASCHQTSEFRLSINTQMLLSHLFLYPKLLFYRFLYIFLFGRPKGKQIASEGSWGEIIQMDLKINEALLRSTCSAYLLN